MIDRTPRMSAAEYRTWINAQAPIAPPAPRTQHDHCKAVRTEGADGSMMASKAEARRSQELELMRVAGEVAWWRPQVSIPCGVSEKGKITRYIVDFMVGWPDGRVTFEDVKAVVDSNRQKRDALRALGLDVRTV